MPPTMKEIELSSALAEAAHDILKAALDYHQQAGEYLTAREQRALGQHLNTAEVLLEEARELSGLPAPIK